ncbi:hypothetical protein TGAMA5MH_01856 [Trichoderma gamsii]|uniref:peptidylprolyl isomerase n=1 Tax=Trichoderma gamsii TaxID=398673 RepID=A0A2K0TN44_9HYPO|nr:hypothetical protein TGAMA5MH_01856 [Trichoderma gamsii]
MGVTVTTLEEGSGPYPLKGQTVVMGYTGWLKDTSQPENKGKKFDSSYDRQGQTFSTLIRKGQVIKGWDKGVPQIKLGGKARLDITSDYAYGPRSIGNIIPANSDLIL